MVARFLSVWWFYSGRLSQMFGSIQLAKRVIKGSEEILFWTILCRCIAMAAILIMLQCRLSSSLESKCYDWSGILARLFITFQFLMWNGHSCMLFQEAYSQPLDLY